MRTETVGQQFEDARALAQCNLHIFTPPYACHSAKVEESRLVYPVVDKITDPDNFRANLRFASGRHAEALVEKYWETVSRFMERLLSVFYPGHLDRNNVTG